MSSRIFWWNTGIAPPVRPSKKAPPVGKRTVGEVISILSSIDHRTTDIICLAEINDKILTSIEFQSYISRTNFTITSFYKVDGKITWDVALLYNRESFLITDSAYVSSAPFSSHKKLAIRIDGEYFGNEIRFYLSHFPGIRTTEKERANMLLGLIFYATKMDGKRPYTIMLGDYNIELCSPKVIDMVYQSRKTCLKTGQIYSPMLKHIGEKYGSHSNIHVSGTVQMGDSWSFVDYALLSNAFLDTQSNIQLDDQNCGIWDELFPETSLYRDHLPIYITLRRR